MVCVVAVLWSSAGMAAQSAAARKAASPEARTAAAMEEARRQGPLALHAFLYAMPKGADLHSHLSGAVYAESWIRAAGEDGLCLNLVTLAFVRRDGASVDRAPCGAGTVAAADLPRNQHLYDTAVNSFSMRTFVPTAAESGHDHFFNSFDKFGGTSHAHVPEWLDEVASRAAAQNEQYLELMQTPDIGPAIAIATRLGFDPNFPEYRQRMLDAGLRNEVPAIRAQIDDYEKRRREIEHCGSGAAAPACGVEVRFLFQVLRNMPPEAVFAQILLGLEVASADPRFVGLNLVQPEDAYFSMRDYELHMRMLAELRPLYPGVRLSLHAGELTPGLVPPSGLSFHVASAVRVAKAERIGHGVDVMDEDAPYALLETMAAQHVLAEINLTSNDMILNVKGEEHPLPLYLKYRVPVALSTDDEGVSRIDLTHEYVRAAETYNLGYAELKRMARNSLEYSFLPGESLWRDREYGRPVAACGEQGGTERARSGCEAILGRSEKARQEWELERRFRVFEAGHGGGRVIPIEAGRRRQAAPPARAQQPAGGALPGARPLLH